MLPDLLDKPIGSIIFNSGRWLGHNVFFQFFVFIILTLVLQFTNSTEKYGQELRLLYVGSSIHLLGDLPGLTIQTLFWPFFGPFLTGSKEGFLYGFESMYIIFTEFIGLLTLVSIGYIQKWDRTQWSVLSAIVVTYVCLFILVYTLLVGF